MRCGLWLAGGQSHAYGHDSERTVVVNSVDWRRAGAHGSLRFASFATWLMTVCITGCSFGPSGTFGIVDYQPSAFTEQPDAPFLFSIGDELRFGRTFGDASPPLFQGELTKVVPSPDGEKAAVVSKGQLFLAEVGKKPTLLLNNVNDYGVQKLGEGADVYLWPSIQWQADSESLFIIRAKKTGERIDGFPSNATLARIYLHQPRSIVDVVNDFRSMKYFLVGSDGICFDYAPGNGDVVWKCSQNGWVETPKRLKRDGVLLTNGRAILGVPFLTYKPNIYETEIWLTKSGFHLRHSEGIGVQLLSQTRPNTPILTVKSGRNFKGSFGDRVSQHGCAILPGGRYALLNLADGSGTVQVLVDGLTGQYRGMPPQTQVYQSLNTSNYKNVSIGFGETDANEFKPVGDLRSYERATPSR